MYFHQPSGVEMHSFSEMIFGIFQYISQSDILEIVCKVISFRHHKVNWINQFEDP